ncbi:MAG: DUF4382 domain-containing protein [Balneolaceae bacterium]
MIYYIKYAIGAILMAVVLISYGCDTSDNGETSYGAMEVWLHDDPADFEEVQIFIERIEINREEDSEGWITIGEPQQHFDLLELTNGAYEVLGSEQLEAGTYSQIRLIVSREDNYVVENGEQKTLFVPGGSETGVKLNVHAEITEGIDYKLLLDFDADRSIVTPGQSGQPADYLLKPVIRATSLAESGHIEGVISPAEARPAVYAISDSDTLSTTFADEETGAFLLFGLDEGSYTVSVEPREEGFGTRDIEDAVVTAGETNDLGDIDLESFNENEEQ